MFYHRTQYQRASPQTYMPNLWRKRQSQTENNVRLAGPSSFDYSQLTLLCHSFVPEDIFLLILLLSGHEAVT